tara:strand:- start:791 stop:1105 length:315 start_codon:yes stop_codon:yes gene_type:complete
MDKGFVMDVNILVFRRDMIQPPSLVGQVSDVIPISENPGDGVDYINGTIHVKFSVTGTNQETCDELKNKIKKLSILPTDKNYASLLDGSLVVTHEELLNYMVDS